MKRITPQLLTFLQTHNAFNRADLFAIALMNGQTIYATSDNCDLTWNGQKYYASRFGAWQRGAVTSEATFRPNSLSIDLQVFANQGILYPGTSTSLMQTLIAGMFDGALVTILTAYWPIGNAVFPPVITGTLITFVGQIANMSETGASKVIFKVSDMLHLLNRPTPPNLIQSSCRHTLFNPNCTLNASNFLATTSLLSSSTTLQFNLNVLPRVGNQLYPANSMMIDPAGHLQWTLVGGTTQPFAPTFATTVAETTVDGSVTWVCVIPDYYTLGKGYVISGQNQGLNFMVKNQFTSGGVQSLQLMAPMPFSIVGGEQIQLYAGCNKMIATCGGPKFGNLIHFGGMPFVPDPSLAI